MPPLISVITPSKNRGAFIGSALQSVQRQDYPYVEHLVIDSLSTDGTLDVLHQYPAVRVVSEPDESSHHAMNKALRVATGDIIGFLNTDDLYPDGILRRVAQRFSAADPPDMICGTAIQFEPRPSRQAPAVTWHEIHPGERRFVDLTLGIPCFNAWFFRRSLFEGVGSFDTSFDVSADREFLLRVAEHATLEIIPYLAYGYRMHDGARSLDRDGHRQFQIAYEHVRMSERYLDRGCSIAAARHYLNCWHAYETARLARWELQSGRSPTRWIRRGFAINRTWPRSVVEAVMVKIQLRLRYRCRPARFAHITVAEDTIFLG
jgi:glycosyltransferase involved in cell wall biosynthesis